MYGDLRSALRLLVRNRGFTVIAVLTLAVGIGANAAMFTLVNALLFHSAPGESPDALRFIYLTDPNVNEPMPVRFRDRGVLTDRTDLFVDVLARGQDVAQMTIAGDARNLRGELVSGNYFEVLGVGPALGRVFTLEDDLPSATPVVIISSRLWRTRFDADPGVIGGSVRLEARPYTIVGVMPDSFRGTLGPLEQTQYWVPLQVRALDRLCRSPDLLTRGGFTLIARLRAGVSAAAAEAALSSIRLTPAYLPAGARPRDRLWKPQLFESGNARLPFEGFVRILPNRLALGLMAVATIVLLIAAANLAGVLSARAISRQTELATRMALGAGRWRVLRQLLTEHLVLAVAAAVIGLVFAQWLVGAFSAAVPSRFTRVTLGSSAPAQELVFDAAIDWRVVLYAVFLSLVTALIVTLAPALQALGRGLLAGLGGGEVVTAAGRRRLRTWILVPQICLSLALLLVAGGLVRSAIAAEFTESGYEPAGVARVSVTLADPPCRGESLTPDQVSARNGAQETALERILARLSDDPAVTGVAFASTVPVQMPRAGGTWVTAQSSGAETGRSLYISRNDVTESFLDLLGIPVVRGRGIEHRDRITGADVVVVSRSLAAALWPGEDPLGRRLKFGEPDSPYRPRWLEVVGVAGDVRSPLVAGGYMRPAVYVPLDFRRWVPMVLARGSGSPHDVIRRIKQAIADAATAARMSDGIMLDDEIEAVIYPMRLAALVLAACGLTALGLACIGIYGVMSYSTEQRVREIGVRMALGAGRRDILRLVLLDGGKVAAIGTAAGLLAGYAALRWASHQLVPLPSLDPAVLAAAPALLAAAVLLASYMPARRAARVDPLTALRHL